MAGVPINFAIPGESAVASYSYTDIINGTGIMTFYGGITHLDGTTFLVSNQINGYSFKLIATSTITFETTVFNTPRTVRGTAYFSGYFADSGDPGTMTVVLSHIDGVTAAVTQIGTGSIVISSLGVWAVGIIPLTTKRFKKGDSLRMTLTHNDATGIRLKFESTNPMILRVPINLDL